jgi:DNA-binding HxlR family transcriptional regulator
MEDIHYDATFCPYFHRAVELVGRRWTGVILRALLHGATRFWQIRDSIPEMNDRMLASRLKELEAEGIITRTVIPDTPVRIEYGLTEQGKDLQQVLATIEAWADRWLTRT